MEDYRIVCPFDDKSLRLRQMMDRSRKILAMTDWNPAERLIPKKADTTRPLADPSEVFPFCDEQHQHRTLSSFSEGNDHTDGLQQDRGFFTSLDLGLVRRRVQTHLQPSPSVRVCVCVKICDEEKERATSGCRSSPRGSVPDRQPVMCLVVLCMGVDASALEGGRGCECESLKSTFQELKKHFPYRISTEPFRN